MNPLDLLAQLDVIVRVLLLIALLGFLAYRLS